MRMLLNRLLLWQKFAILALLGSVLVIAPLALYVKESNKARDQSQREAGGIVPVRALLTTVLLMQQHRGLSAMVLAGNETAQARRASKQQELDKSLAAAHAAIETADDTRIAGVWRDARARWDPLVEKVAQRSLNGKESFEQHTAIIGMLFNINSLLLDRYGLTLDPDLDTSYLVSLTLMESPMLMETIGRMRAKGSGLLTAKAAQPEDRAQMMSMLDNANDRYAAVGTALQKTIDANPALGPILMPHWQAAVEAGKEVTRITRSAIVAPEQPAFAASNYFATTTAAIEAQVKLYDAAVAELDTLLQARAAALTRTTRLLIAGIVLLVVATGFMAFAIVRSITVPLLEAVTLAQRVAKGDLTARVATRSRNETGQLLQSLQDMNDSLIGIVGQVRASTGTIATASGQISSGNSELLSRTEQQAGAIEETAATMEQMTGTVRQNAGNAREANALAASASEVAVKGGAMVAQVVDMMSGINDSSKKIVDIIGVIDGIAFQTNILALNAAVEAARAGEQGKGFAVVAAEVRNLAQRSAAAAKEIKALIQDSVEKVDTGAKLVNQTGATMHDIVAGIQRVGVIIGEITTASQEQASGIEQVNQTIGHMDQTTQQNASLVGEAAAAAASLHEQAEQLSDIVSVFRIGDGAR